jgi:hypothetical protein
MRPCVHSVSYVMELINRFVAICAVDRGVVCRMART